MKKCLKITAIFLTAMILLGAFCSCGRIVIPDIVDDLINFEYTDLLEKETESEKTPWWDFGSDDESEADVEDDTDGIYDDGESEEPESTETDPDVETKYEPDEWESEPESDREVESESEPEPEPDKEFRERILLVTDFHYVKDWYGVSDETRMELMVAHINAEHKKDPVSMIVFMGDYSLDHWKWDSKKPYVTFLNTGVSHTQKFMDQYKDMLPDVPMFWIAGNHEQFGEDTWVKMVGNSRQGYKVIGDYLLIMWDSYGAELDPDYHHDGVYSPMDTEWVGEVMDKYPDKKVILISHFFDSSKEKGNSEKIVKDSRVVALFVGHQHHSRYQTLGSEFGNKYLIFAGNYSYGDGDNDPGSNPWGFRDLILTDDYIKSTYIIPANTIKVNGSTVKINASEQNSLTIYVKK